jgi:hypothetical protein
MNYRDFWEAGYLVFGLYGSNADGTCKCGDPDCKAVLKHPLVSNWQHTPHWSEEQLEIMETTGQFEAGYGVLLRSQVVVDVDTRNGGLESFEKLLRDVPEVAGAGLIVNTGSGGGSRHLYFKVPPGVALVTKHPDYPGIDFKSGAAYVVGPGSLHASGRRYEVAVGTPDDIDYAPEALIKLLTKPERHRAELGNRMVDVSHADLEDMLRYIDNDDVDYETWVRVGMALHHASGGTAYNLWEDWSARSSKHDPRVMPNKWHSFGKGANPVTLGTLAHYAEQGGWKQPVTFTPDVEFDFTPAVEDTGEKIDVKGIDLLRPPGLAGRVAEWINTRTRKKRERLASLAAIVALSNAAGLRYMDDIDRATTNLFVFNVAGSATGKDALIGAINEIMLECGLAAATHGTIKSEQEIMRNLTRNQAAFYLIDEIGFLLQKIKSAQKRGGAIYMEGIIGLLMSVYSKADGRLLISGDLKEDTRQSLRKELTQLEKQIDDVGEKPYLISRRDALAHLLSTIDHGLDRPFLSLCGYTTGQNFDELVDFDGAANGFIGRAILNIETDTAPQTKLDWVKHPLPENLKIAMQQIAMGGSFDMNRPADARVEHYGERIVIPTEPAAKEMLRNIVRYFDRMAYDQKSSTGLEAIPQRGYEQVTKISLTLAVPEGVRTVEHVRWAFALIKRDIETKIRMVVGNENAKDDPAKAMMAKVAQLISGDDGETLGVIVNRLGKQYRKEDIEACLRKLVDNGDAEVEESIHRYNKRKTLRYKLKDNS